MDVNPGDFNRLISVERISSRGNVLGGAKGEVWQEQYKVWAKVKGITSRDRIRGDGGIRSSVAGVFTIPYTDDLLATDRIMYQNKSWRVTGLAEIGYRELLEVSAEVADE